MSKLKLLIFASGSKEGGGSGFEKLVENSKNGILDAEIVGVVSNHAFGGVYQRSKKLKIPFMHLPKPWSAEQYQLVAREFGADFFALSGWLKLVFGLDPETSFNSKTVFNIHPGLLPEYGGVGMHGHHVHEKVMQDYKEGKITRSGLSMHFVTPVYDQGPVFCKRFVDIIDGDNAETLGARVNIAEHNWQAKITNMVVHGEIQWDGIREKSLHVPSWYSINSDA